MKRAIQEKLIGALRSGEYEQTQGAFEVGGSYCVMGVLGAIYVQEGGYNSVKDLFSWSNLENKKHFYEWAGIDSHLENLFIELNDDANVEFDEFATILAECFDPCDLDSKLQERRALWWETQVDEEYEEGYDDYEDDEE